MRYAKFSADRPINRLIQSSLYRLSSLSKDRENQKRIRQIRFHFNDIPESLNIENDIKSAHIDRTMPVYARIFPWLKLFLKDSSPTTWQGQHLSFGLLFPMEKVFEDHVTHRLRKEMQGWQVSSQDRHHYLVHKNHDDRPEFQLRPDIVARKKDANGTLILDAKWKRLDPSKDHFGISQSDMYQLYAYGKRYQRKEANNPRLYLLYPANREFKTVRRYCYEEELFLEVRPVALETMEQPILAGSGFNSSEA